jgi:hypothetical protein
MAREPAPRRATNAHITVLSTDMRSILAQTMRHPVLSPTEGCIEGAIRILGMATILLISTCGGDVIVRRPLLFFADAWP